MRDLALAKAYAAQGFGLGGVLLKQSLYPGAKLRALLDGARLVLDFGCGEGLLTNLLSRALPRARFVGVDLDAKKISAATACRTHPQTEFIAGDFFDCSVRGADAVIFNDVLHHLSPERQLAALQHAADCLTEDGLIILKEVDPADRLDVRHTTFWDSRLYANDTLLFSSPGEWVARLGRLGFRSLGSSVVRHPWIASRTLLWFTRRPKLAEFATPVPLVAIAPGRAVLVTGATGFIGEWVTRQLLEHGLDGQPVRVDVVVRDSLRLPADLRGHSRVRVLTGDLTDNAFNGRLAGPYAAVFHLAAAVDYFGGQSVYDHNLRATTGLIDACGRLRPDRFIYTSTMGALDRSRADFCSKPLDETSTSHPTSPYGRAKYEEEKIVQRAADLNWTIARIPWCYGPGMAESHHVRNLLNRVRTGSAACRLNWPGRVSVIEVREAARQLVALVTKPATIRETFFLAEDEPISMGDLFAEMGRTVGSTSAASARVPRWLWSLSRLAQPILPFQLKCLVADALVVSTTKARALGVQVAPRTKDFLVPLARYNANALFPSRHGAAALITGAASGIGACLCRQLYSRGYQLIMADRNELQLNASARVYAGAQTWVVDLSSPELPSALAERFGSRESCPELIINNAGVGWRGPSWSATPADTHRVISVNAEAPSIISSYFLHASSGPVVIVNIASTAAFQPLPYMAAYAAAKSYILSFSLALDAELQAAGRRDRVITVVPGGTKTGFQSTAGVGTHAKEKLLSPDDVSCAILAGVTSKRSLIFVGSRARAMSVAASLIPLRRQAALWEKLMRNLR
ncbi:MAG: SDR family NAD(P)-dependent oxidoreductase [Opitutus sp.]